MLEQKTGSTTPATGRRSRKGGTARDRTEAAAPEAQLTDVALSTSLLDPIDVPSAVAAAPATDASAATLVESIDPAAVLAGLEIATEVVDPARLARRTPAKAPSWRGLAAKRMVDIVGRDGGLIVLSPGPARRRGRDRSSSTAGRSSSGSGARASTGRPFQIVKFRTMGSDADAAARGPPAQNEIAGGASFKMTNDPRITRIGRFLRRTSIDELPQLWNVLRGEMSLVGPRPHPFDDVAGYDDWHRRRLSMKPGITGLWQVGGRTETDFDRWVAARPRVHRPLVARGSTSGSSPETDPSALLRSRGTAR